MTDWDPSAVAAALRTENRFSGGSVVGVLAIGHSQTRMWVLESASLMEDASVHGGGRVSGNPVILAESRLDNIGGELFDRMLFERATERITGVPGADDALAGRLREPVGEPWRGLQQRLFLQVRRAREELTAWHSATVEIDGIPGLTPDGPLRLDRIELDNALRRQVLQMARTLQSTIESSGHRPATLDGIYLLGDARMPLIVRSVYDVLGVSPTMLGQDPSAAPGLSKAATRTAAGRIATGGPGQPASPAEGLSLRPTPNAKGKNGKVVAGLTTPPAPVEVGSPPSSSTPEHYLTPGKNVEAARPDPELTDTGSLRLLGHPGDGFDVEAASASAAQKNRRRLLVPAAGGAVVMVAASLIVAGLVHNNTLPSPTKTDRVQAASATITPTTPPATPTPSLLPPVESLQARTVGISIALNWAEVPGAEQYSVYRDQGTQAEEVRTATTPKLADRPGDGRVHTYTVVALDADEVEGEPGEAVAAKAPTPYGKLQNIASTWTGIVPVRPGVKGSSGQVCRANPGKAAGATGSIVCRYPGKLTLTVFDYSSEAATGRRYKALRAMKGVAAGGWKAEGDTGRLLVGGRRNAPWRWWTYESAPTTVVQANWPGHTSTQLAAWAKKRMPFHN
ncbi:hypothetical protein GCM10022223_21490 [Kineosporia mesophila]|uniref:Fibronectin type-III domain-containing protein n=1 Tax=Kineosporia mesophila TaxID=566012 RepID=A0ABP6ZI78_9ACTN|nr:hypothetical protein [Kineosporia mesophila]MCD5350239.1 hypothetical protein [Kineosporia mesophila]